MIGGVYAQTRMQFADNRLLVTPELRINYFSADSKIYLEPRVSASYTLTNRLTLNAATGIFNQFANRIVREDIMSGNTDFWILSDGEEIPVSKSYHFNLGINLVFINLEVLISQQHGSIQPDVHIQRQ